MSSLCIYWYRIIKNIFSSPTENYLAGDFNNFNNTSKTLFRDSSLKKIKQVLINDKRLKEKKLYYSEPEKSEGHLLASYLAVAVMKLYLLMCLNPLLTNSTSRVITM